MTVSTPPTFVSPVPRSEVKVEPLIPKEVVVALVAVKFVVEAVVKNPIPDAEMLVVEALAKIAVPVKVGEPANTAAPVPVSSVSAPERFAELKEPRSVALPVEVIAPVRLALVVTVPAVSPEAVPVSPVPAPVKELAKIVPEAEKTVDEAPPLKLWSPVHVLALPRLSPMVCAVPPLYAPEKVREPLVAVRLLRVEPRAMPLIVEFWSWLLPMVEVETKEVPLKERS